MSVRFVGEGNLGRDPSFKITNPESDGSGEEIEKLEVSIYFQNLVYKNGSYQEDGSFWAVVEIWGKAAEHNHRILKKGDRVLVAGRLKIDTYTPTKGRNKGQEVQAPVVTADAIGLQCVRLETVQRRTPDSPKPATTDTPCPALAGDSEAPPQPSEQESMTEEMQLPEENGDNTAPVDQEAGS